MGNQLVGVAPSQIYPVEHYLMGSTFESDLQYESRYRKLFRCFIVFAFVYLPSKTNSNYEQRTTMSNR